MSSGQWKDKRCENDPACVTGRMVMLTTNIENKERQEVWAKSLIRDTGLQGFPKYTKSSYNSTTTKKQTTQLKNGQKT